MDESKDISQELHDEIPELTMFDFDGDVLCAQYESFSFKFDVTKGLDVGFHVEFESFSFDPIIPDLMFKFDDNVLHIEYDFFCAFNVDMNLSKDFGVEYESFSVGPIQTDLLFEYCKFEFVESEMIATKNFNLNQTLVLLYIKRRVTFEPSLWPRLLVYAEIVSRPVTSPLAPFEYVHFLPDWAPLFDKSKRTLTYAFLAIWMYSIWFQLSAFQCCYTIESWASVFDKLLRALTSFDLSSTLSA